MSLSFHPSGLLRNPHIQSILASSGLRALQASRRFPKFIQSEQAIVLDGGEGVRLSGVVNRQENSRGLAVMIHGWEGSVHSSYLIAVGGRLFSDGFDVLRVNLRDHGDSHGLNRELFHSCRLNEVVHAIADQLRQIPHQRALVGGFSLGGNFALRVARAMPEAFQFVFSICPPLVPKHSLIAIENAPWFYHAYFMRKWTNSLRLKQKLFPNHFDFSSWRGLKLRQLTEVLVKEHTDYPHVDDYLDGYAIGGDRLLSLAMPSLVVAAKDDPVIPIQDFYQLQKPPGMQLEILQHGGHCGFLANLRLESHIEHRVARALRELFN